MEVTKAEPQDIINLLIEQRNTALNEVVLAKAQLVATQRELVVLNQQTQHSTATNKIVDVNGSKNTG
jgi:hypothetical protein